MYVCVCVCVTKCAELYFYVRGLCFTNISLLYYDSQVVSEVNG